MSNRWLPLGLLMAASFWATVYSPAAIADIEYVAKILNNCTPASGVKDTTARYRAKENALQLTVEYFGAIEMAFVRLDKLASLTYTPGKGLEFLCENYEMCVGVAPVSKQGGKYKLENDVVAQNSFRFLGCESSALQDAADEFNN